MYILISILGLIILLVLVLILLGLLSSKTYDGQITDTIAAPPGKVFAMLKDIESLPLRRKEIEKIEMLAPTDDGRARWREIAKMGGFAEFELLSEKENEYIEVKIVRSSFGITGVWRYELEANNGATRITVTEKSKADKLFIRSFMALAGRNATLRQEIRNLKQSLKD